MMPATDHDVVLCYNNVDKEHVERLQVALGAWGIDCWVDFNSPMAGGYWRKQVKEAWSHSNGAIVILGPAGQGESQDDEIMYFIETGKHLKRRLLFVLLPDAEPLDEIGAAGISYIRAKQCVDEPAVIAQIHAIFKPGAAGFASKSGFFRDLNLRPRSCFLALPKTKDPELLPLLCEIAQKLDCSVVQDADGTRGDFESDVLNGVASASFVIADGRCPEGTNALDPAVGHVLGIARAYGKPIIVVIDPQRKPLYPTYTADCHIDYDLTRPLAGPELRTELARQMTLTLGSLKQNGMLAADARNMLVIFHSTLRPAQWKQVAQTIANCKPLADEFSAVGHHLQALSIFARQASVAEDDWQHGNEATQRWEEFCATFNDDYCRRYASGIVPQLNLWAERQGRLIAAIAELARTEGGEAGKAFGKSREFLRMMAKSIERFNGVHDLLTPRAVMANEAWQLGPSWWFKQLTQMREYADEVVANSLAAIVSFLPLFGYEAEQIQGVKTHANGSQSTTAIG